MGKVNALAEPDDRHPPLLTLHPEIRPHHPDTLSFFGRIASNTLFFNGFLIKTAL
jgi:hypothetical protein